MSFILNGNTLSRPKQFSREYLSITQDYKTLSGKAGRDVRLIGKERFIMSWEILSPAELAVILGIVNTNTPVDFSVTEENLSIPIISVIVRISTIEYSIVGNSYLTQTSIELEEVQ